MKIQRKFRIIALLILTAISITCILFNRNISISIIKQQITNNLINTTQSRTEHIKTFLDLEKEAVKQGSESVIIEELLLAEKEEEDYLLKYNKVIRRLKYTTQMGKYTYDIFVLDTKGIIIASSDEEDIGKDKSNDPYFLEGKERVFIKDVYISPHKQRKTLAFSAPIIDEEDKNFLGVLVFRVSPERLFQITTGRTGLGETGEVYLINKDGYMITPSRFVDEVFLKQKVDLRHIHTEEVSPTEPSNTPPEEEIYINKDYRGIEVLSAHAHLAEKGWCLVAQIDTKEAFAPITKLTNSLLLIFAIILFIVIFVSNFVTRTITEPLRKLHKGTEEITKGNLDYKVGTPSPDEIGQLSRAFDEMTANLKKSRKELEEYSRNLEKKVEERTRDLEVDISKRKKTEENLRAEKEFTDTLIDTAQVIVLLLDKEGKIVRFNSYMEEITGYKLEEVKGKSWFDTFLPERDREKIQEVFHKAINNISTKGNINPIITKDGWEVEIEWYDKTLKDENNKTIGLLAIGLNITERKKLQQALQESEEKLSYALQATNDGIWDRNLESGELYLSDNYYKILGYNPGEITINQKVFEEFLHPEDKEGVLQKIQECIKGKTKDYNAEFRIKTKSGKWKWILGRGNVVSRDSNGKPLRFLGTHVDITKRREMEEALRESEEKFYSISSSAYDAIFFIDNDANIIYCNKAAEKMFGYSKKEMSGEDLHKLIVPSKYYNDYKKGFRAFRKTGKGPAIGKTLELSAIRKNGEEFSVALSLSAVKLKGKWNAIGIIRDISQQKKAEEKLEKLARIDSLTGCNNRGYGLELLDRQIKLSKRNKSPLLLAFLDIDRFKSINDNFGHDEGDRVLKEVTGLFKSTLREIDIICRMGGDEFLLIFPDSSLKDASLIRERLNKNLTELNQALNTPYKIELSVGLSCYDPDNPQSADELIRIADKKMYGEKKKKK